VQFFSDTAPILNLTERLDGVLSYIVIKYDVRIGLTCSNSSTVTYLNLEN